MEHSQSQDANNETERLSFVVRFVREQPNTPWRVSVRSAADNQIRYFADVGAVCCYFAELTQTPLVVQQQDLSEPD